jgi:TPR repeat protein
MATLLLNGTNSEPGPARAARYFRKAADQGNDVGGMNCGYMLKDVQGVTKDLEQEVEYFQRAAMHDNVEAQLNDAMCLMVGQGKQKDEKKATMLLRGTREYGNVVAMYIYATCLETGRGTFNPRRALRNQQPIPK